MRIFRVGLDPCGLWPEGDNTSVCVCVGVGGVTLRIDDALYPVAISNEIQPHANRSLKLAGLEMNQSTLSVIPNEQGGVIDDTMITKCPDHIYQVINAGCGQKDLDHLDEQLGRFGGDVNLEVAWETDRGLFALQGTVGCPLLASFPGAMSLLRLTSHTLDPDCLVQDPKRTSSCSA
jgi:hypothetical protein